MQAPDPKLSRRERERLTRRGEILDAARQVFAEKGFAGATLEELANRADFGKGTLYNYFPGGKEEILFAVFDGLYDDLCELIAASFPDGSAPRPARQAFQQLIEAYFDYFESRSELFMVLTKEGHRMSFSDDPDRMAYFLRQRDRVAHALTVPIERAIESGELRPLAAEAVAHMIIGNIQGCRMHQAINALGTDREVWSSSESARFLTTLLFDGLLVENDRVVQSK